MADINLGAELKVTAVGAQTAWDAFIAGGQAAGKATNASLGGTVKKDIIARVIVDDQGLNKIVLLEKERLSVVDKLQAALKKANDLERDSVTSLRQQVNQAKQLRDSMAKYGASVDGIFTKVGKVNGAWETQNARVKDLQRQLDIAGASNIWQRLSAEYNLGGLASAGRQISELVNVFQSVSIIVGQVIGSVNQLFDSLQKLQSIRLTFEGIGKGSDVDKVFSESSRIALGLGVSLNTVRDGFQQLSPVILATGGNINDVSAITESLSSRFVTFGLSADKSRRVMNGVVQAFSKGKLMAEELTQQISEADPAFRTDLATAIGVTVKELGDMVKAGEVTNELLLDAIPRMSKSAGLFGKLGDSALDAAQGFREGGVTVEQFRNQIATIEQLSLENLVNPDTGPLQPLLASLLELRAVVTDVGVAFANSEVFRTFLTLLGDIASQISSVVQVSAALISAIASITQPIFGAINAINTLGGRLENFGIISSLVAGIITAKLVFALGALAVSGVVGTAIGGLKLLTAAVNLLNSGAIINLIKTIGLSIAAFIGLGGATAQAAAKEGLATIVTKARTVASAALTGQLLKQAAAEKLLGGIAPGGTAGGPKITRGAGAPTGVAPVYGPAPPPPSAQIAQAKAAAEATDKINKLKTAWTGLRTAVAAAASGIGAAAIATGAIAVTAALAAGVIVYSSWNGLTGEARTESARFAEGLKKIDESAKKAKDAIDKSGSSAKVFETELSNLKIRPDDFISKNFGPDLWRQVRYDELIKGAKTAFGDVDKRIDASAKAVQNYSEVNDKTGKAAEKVAIDINTAEKSNQLLLDQTKKKRQDLLTEVKRGGKGATVENKRQITEYNKIVGALEQNKQKIIETKKAAEGKGVVLIEADVKPAIDTLEQFDVRVKSLKALLILETDPAKQEKLQGEINAIEAQLRFLQSDRIEFKINAEFKINQRALQDGLGLSQAIIGSLQASVEYTQSLLNLQAGYLSGQERTSQSELESINERLSREKEIRQEKLEAAEEAGASEGEIKKLKAEDRAADKAGRAEIKAVEAELKKLAESKRQIEIQGIQAKLNALPAQQEAERESLRIQQNLARLELERLTNAARRAKLEAVDELNDTSKDIDKAGARGDDKEVQRLTKLFNLQIEYINLLKEEEKSLQNSANLQGQANKYIQEALAKKQASATLDLQAQLASQNALVAQQQTATAVQGTATAMANVATNAAGYAQAAQTGSEYERSGALAARIKADAEADATAQAEDGAKANRDGAAANKAATTSTKGAIKPTDATADNLTQGADAAQRLANSLTDLPNKIDIAVNIVGGPLGLWTGGPTVGGQTYRINELGKEGFLSSTGDLSPINKPRNALWKAPGKGMVIPAHIMSTLDVPTGRVSTGVRPAVTGSGSNGLTKIARAIQAALSQNSKPDSGLQEMAAVQAHQAIQIGKLSRAVTKLADKDWNVNVGVRNTGSTAYLDALNRRM
jgi:tape measure domain-containing protein